MKLKQISLIAIAVGGLLFATASLYAQAAAPAAEGAATPAAHKVTLWDRILEGGWVMVPIALCSIATVYFAGDGILRTGHKRTVPDDQTEALKNLFRQGDYVGAYNYCKENPSPFTNVLRVGVSLLGDGKQISEEGLTGELSKEHSKMMTYISYLSVIGVTAPMIGLLGTVTGMIRAFQTLGASGIGDPSKLAGAIGEVLTATASGLIIAIPAFIFFYYLRNRVTVVIQDIQDVVNTLYRKMPYESLAGVHIGDEELYAATPNWVAPQGSTLTGSVPAPNSGGAVTLGE